MHFTGAGIYAVVAAPDSIGPIDNNGLIIATNSSPSLLFECASNFSQSHVGVITGTDASELNNGDPLFRGGTWTVVNPFFRPGVLRIRANGVLSPSDQGVYSCTIPDDNGAIFIINVGLYPSGYQSEKP